MPSTIHRRRCSLPLRSRFPAVSIGVAAAAVLLLVAVGDNGGVRAGSDEAIKAKEIKTIPKLIDATEAIKKAFNIFRVYKKESETLKAHISGESLNAMKRALEKSEEIVRYLKIVHKYALEVFDEELAAVRALNEHIANVGGGPNHGDTRETSLIDKLEEVKKELRLPDELN